MNCPSSDQVWTYLSGGPVYAYRFQNLLITVSADGLPLGLKFLFFQISQVINDCI